MKNKITVKESDRRDSTGHLTPKYKADLRAMSKASADPKREHAFLKGPKSKDPLAEELGEAFVRNANNGQDDEPGLLDAVVAAEAGGPFVETSGKTEFAEGVDPSNPDGTLREPFPTT